MTARTSKSETELSVLENFFPDAENPSDALRPQVRGDRAERAIREVVLRLPFRGR